jgi:drug/metabolite transporter (DMT)-like permease
MFEKPYADWTYTLTLSMIWNILMVSVLAMWIYSIMLTREQAGRAASAFFIVPGVTALSAWIMLNQTLSPYALLGLLIASFGVWLVWWRVE